MASGAMRRILAIGIGTGNPDHLTVQAVQALRRVDVVFLLDKGSSKADLGPVRREICARYIESGSYRLIELPDSERDPSVSSYTERVEDWHERRVERFELAIEAALPESGCGAFLVWGDPSLYDSTLRILDALARRGRLRFEYEVIPGLSSPQVLAARHKIILNRIGGAVQITTGRRLAAGWPEAAQDVVVMLDGECSFRTLPAEDLDIYWGAYLGTEHELLIKGPLAERKAEIVAVRAQARERHGWIMDTYLLRRISGSKLPDSSPGQSLPEPPGGGIVAALPSGERI
jgi:precorrin-6A synthase